MKILGIVILFFAATAYTQDLPSASLRKGTWDFGVQTGGGTGGVHRRSFGAQFWTAGLRIGELCTAEHGQGWRRGNLECGMDIIPVFLVFEREAIYGGGSNLFLKWTFTRGKKLAPYYELGLGMLFTKSNLPSGDTSTLNFTAQTGPGIYIFTHEKRALALGVEFLHISNAFLGNFNPGINVVHFALEYHWFHRAARRDTP